MKKALITGITGQDGSYLAEAFGYVGLDWEKYTRHDSRYERPSEVDQLLGDASKAKKFLGWEPKVTFKGLVRMMMDADLELARKELAMKEA